MIPAMQLTRRWTPLRPHRQQRLFWESEARFNLVPAGRRSGKTEIAKRRAVRKGLLCPHENGWVVVAAPTRMQAKRIYWPDLKALVPRALLRGKPIESELILPLINGCDIQVMGLDEPARVEGRSLWHILLDEYANMKEIAWPNHVRPALADWEGSADLIGVPEGRNHFYHLYEDACRFMEDGDPDWRVFKWSARSVLSAKEIASIVRDLDALTARQEIDADFVDFSGVVYHAFNDANIISELPVNPHAPIDICLDFNTAPGVAAFVQEARNKATKEAVEAIVDEIHIPMGSNTPRVCREIVSKLQGYGHDREVRVYGDATGGIKKTSSVEGSDIDLVKKYLKLGLGERVSFHFAKSNPSERARVNSVNSRLCSETNRRRLFVVRKCRHTILDFQGLRCKPDGSIDKDLDPKLSHLTDGIGYRIHRLYPVKDRFAIGRAA